MKSFQSFISEEEKVKRGKEISVGKNTVKINPDSEELKEVAPPTAKAERMVKHIKKSYSKDGKLTDKEKEIAYATAWKHHNTESYVPGKPAERLGAVTAIPQSERDAAKASVLAKTAAKRKEMEKVKEELEIEEGLDKRFDSMRKRGGRSAPEGERSIGGEANRRNKDYWADEGGKNRDRGAGNKAKRRADALKKEEIELIDERRKEDKVAGTPRNDIGKADLAYRAVKKTIRDMSGGRPAGQRKKEPGKKPPTAGQYGGPKSPAQKVAMRRAAAQRSQDNMSSRYD